MYRNKNNQSPMLLYYILLYVLFYTIKIIKKYQYTNCTNGANSTNFNCFNKVTIYIFGFCLSYMDSGYFSFYTNCIPNMIFSNLSFSILILYTDNK